MCELVEVARVMIEELGADVTVKNQEGLTAAEAIRDEGDCDDLAEYLESVTPGVVRREDETGALEYTEFRDGEDGEERGLPPGTAARIDEIMRLEQEDGVNRDEELRNIVTEAILRQMGRSQNGSNGNAVTRRPRRYSDDGNESSDQE